MSQQTIIVIIILSILQVFLHSTCNLIQYLVFSSTCNLALIGKAEVEADLKWQMVKEANKIGLFDDDYEYEQLLKDELLVSKYLIYRSKVMVMAWS